MSLLDLRDPYEFDPETDLGEGGGLPGRLHRYAQQYGIDFGPMPSNAPEYDPNAYGSPQGGLLGRLSVLQAEQRQYQPVAANVGQVPFAPQNPNLTQIPQTRITVRPLDVHSTYDPETGESEGGGLLGRLHSYAQQHGIDFGPMPSGAPEYSPDSHRGPQGVPTERYAPVLAGPPWIGRAGPMPPVGLGKPPPTPMPRIPEWWHNAQELLKLYARMRYGAVGSNRRRDDDDYCDERYNSEAGKCWVRKEDYVYPDFLFNGCLVRAKDRLNLCNKNGGRPDPSEPPEWGLKDEEIWRNYYR